MVDPGCIVPLPANSSKIPGTKYKQWILTFPLEIFIFPRQNTKCMQILLIFVLPEIIQNDGIEFKEKLPG